MTIDMVFRGPLFYQSQEFSFSRVGYVSHTTAKILVREPDPAQLPLFISYRRENSRQKALPAIGDDSWTLVDKIYYLTNETDFTYSLELTKLFPSTEYEYAISNGKSGSFITAARPGTFSQGTSKFTFLTTSCIKPRFPYSPLSHPLHIPGLSKLSTLLPSLQASFMLFLGDFIYIDVPQRFGWKAETYRAEYRRVYASPSWSSAAASLPWLHVIDDHEIANDWDRGLEDPYPAAADPFTIYQHSLNPPSVSPNASYYSFVQGPASFFLLDTRRYRSPVAARNSTDPAKTMLGAKQLQAVLAWLAAPEPDGVKWKILVSSVPFTRNWRMNSQDGWAGYLAERQTLLEAMWDATSKPSGPGIVVLSGDRHEFAATSFPAPDAHKSEQADTRWAPGAKVIEFSCSPLNMFYLPLRSYWEVPGEHTGVGAGGEDRCVKYLPDGNSKFGAVEIENELGSGQSLLRYRLFVDGIERWNYVLTTLDGREGGREAVWG